MFLFGLVETNRQRYVPMGHRKSPSLQTAQVGMFSTSSSLDSGESCVENDVGDQTKALLLNEEVLKEACKQRIGIDV